MSIRKNGILYAMLKFFHDIGGILTILGLASSLKQPHRPKRYTYASQNFPEIQRLFTWQQLYPLHENHVLFVVSHWQFDKSKPSFIYLLYRTLLAAFLVATWWVSLEEKKYPIYLTNWGYTMCLLQILLAFFMVFFCLSIRVYWITHVAATSAGFVITLIYWTVLYKPDKTFTALNFYVHGSNSIVLLIDLLIIGHPVRFLHFVYPVLFGLAYIIFNVAYYFYDTY
ncbi:hypothetical protein NQ317_006910, partial [Molorchus minor]